MQRALYHQLANWKKSKNRKPLLLQGARQVGKTFLLETFAKEEYADCCYVNFEENPRCKDFFKDKLEPRKILQQLSLYLSQEITPEKTLIIFDEIQDCPEALTSLKYFCEDAREYHIAGAGSLLGIRLARTKSFPVGKVNFLHLYPLSFFEFLDAMGKQNLKNYLEEIDNVVPLSLPIHTQLLELLRLYLFVGGMPEAVKCYSETEQPLEVREIQNEILKAYTHHTSRCEILIPRLQEVAAF